MPETLATPLKLTRGGDTHLVTLGVDLHGIDPERAHAP